LWRRTPRQPSKKNMCGVPAIRKYKADCGRQKSGDEKLVAALFALSAVCDGLCLCNRYGSEYCFKRIHIGLYIRRGVKKMINLNEKQYMRLQTLFLCAFLFSFLLAGFHNRTWQEVFAAAVPEEKM